MGYMYGLRRGGVAVPTEYGHVLIIDHDKDARTLLTQLFAQAGFATLESATGQQALTSARKRRLDLVLLEVSLPDSSGFEICRQLRDHFGEDLPIIFVAGERIEPSDRAVGILIGADDYVVKPFHPDELLARARRAITRSQVEQTAPASSDARNLSKRESQVLGLLAQGQTQSDIARDLSISPKTVDSHMQRIFTKLGVHSGAQAVAVAYQSSLLSGAMEEEPEEAESQAGTVIEFPRGAKKESRQTQ
jgi:DNA-binding NarL/FixJ family response regulator